jgi:hypothetical protein
METFKQETFNHPCGQAFDVFFSSGHKRVNLRGHRRCLKQSKSKMRLKKAGQDISTQCENKIKHAGTTACHYHGGSTPVGTASPHTKTGEHSKYPLNGLGTIYSQHLKGKRKEMFQDALTRTDLSLVPDIALLQTMITEELEKEGGGDDKKVRKLVDERTRVIAIEVKNLTSMQSVMQVSTVNLILASVMQVLGYKLMESIEDKRIVASVMRGTKEHIEKLLPVYDSEGV